MWVKGKAASPPSKMQSIFVPFVANTTALQDAVARVFMPRFVRRWAGRGQSFEAVVVSFDSDLASGLVSDLLSVFLPFPLLERAPELG